MDTCDHRELRVAGQGKHNPRVEPRAPYRPIGERELSLTRCAPTCHFLSFYVSQEEFLDVIYWARQAIGIIVGIGWGLIPLKGFIALLL